jgi:hypothetical protein
MAKRSLVQFSIMYGRQYWVNVKNCDDSHRVPFSVCADLNTLLGQCSGSCAELRNVARHCQNILLTIRKSDWR